jgi:hypothetical protein
MFKAFDEALIKYNRRYILVSGNKKKRLKLAINEIDKLISNK